MTDRTTLLQTGSLCNRDPKNSAPSDSQHRYQTHNCTLKICQISNPKYRTCTVSDIRTLDILTALGCIFLMHNNVCCPLGAGEGQELAARERVRASEDQSVAWHNRKVCYLL